MKIVTPLLKRAVYPALSKSGCFCWMSGSGLAVVTYHGILPAGYKPIDPAFDGNLISAEMFRQQLRLLKSHYRIVSPEDVHSWSAGGKLPQRAVLLTCDDGLLNCLTDMLPLLQEEGVQCLFFVTGASADESRTMLWYEELFLILDRVHASRLEFSAEGIALQGSIETRTRRRDFWWDSVQQLSRLDCGARASFLEKLRICVKSTTPDLKDTSSTFCRRYRILTRPELRQLSAAGMSIGAHTLSHPMLSRMPSDLAYGEVAESRMRLESVLQQQIWAFAYPFGNPQSVTPEVLAMPSKAGYSVAFLNFGGGLGSGLPRFALPRIHVTAEMGLGEFEAHVCGFYGRLQRGAGRGSNSVEAIQGAAPQ